MRCLKTNTAVRLVVGPFVSITNGYTLKTGLTVTEIAMSLWHEHDDGSAPTKTIDGVAFTVADGGTNDMRELASGYYDIEITAVQTNFVGRAKFQIYDIDKIVPYFEDWIVLPAQVFDSLLGTDLLDVNTAQINGQGQTAGDVVANVSTILADYARRTGDYATVAALSTLQGNVTTILADYARRTGDYATVAALSTLQGNVTTILADYARRTGDYATVAALSTLQGNVTTILADYARRTGDYSVLAAGAAMTLTEGEREAVANETDTQLSGTHGSGRWGGGNGGSLAITNYPVTDSVTGLPVAGATVELYPTVAYTGIIDRQITDSLGHVTFSNLTAGTYYIKVIRAGYEDFYDTEVAA
jgi:hypothetical protein